MKSAGTSVAIISGTQTFLDDVLLRLGTDGDQVFVNRSTTLAANTALTNVVIGTPVTPAIAANSLILSNVTASGDLLVLANRGGNSEAYLFVDSSAGTLTLFSRGTGALTLTPATDVVVSNATGLIVGATAQVNTLGGLIEVQVLGTAVTDAGGLIGRWSADTGGPVVIFAKSRNATIGSFTVVANGDVCGSLFFCADDGVDIISEVALIRAEVDGVPGANDTPGRLMFFTTADGAALVTERMRINSSGLIGYGTTDIEAWTTATPDVFQIGDINAISSGDTVGNGLLISQNAYSDGTWKYRTTAVASQYYQASGAHVFRAALSGTIDGAITWVNLLYLDGATKNSVTIGGTTSGASATFNLVFSGGATSPVLGDGTTDLVSLAGVDFLGGDRRLYIQSELGSRIILGNNVLTLGLAGTSTGSMTLSGATSGIVSVTVAAAAGTWTLTLPTTDGASGEQLQTDGAGITSWAAAGSLLAYKELLPESEWLRPQDALDRILHTRVAAFHYRAGMGTQDTDTLYTGVIADPEWSGSAPWAMHYKGGIVNPINTFGYTVLAFQAHETELERLRQRVADLEGQVALLKG